MEKQKVTPPEAEETTEENPVEATGVQEEPEDIAEEVGSAPEGATVPVEEQLQQLEKEKADIYDQLLRQRAEFENVRKRLDREALEKRLFAESKLVESLLPVLDGLERALASLPDGGPEGFGQGVELIHKQFLSTLAQAGLKSFESVGQPFDPFYHHAVERVETNEHPDHQVLEELQCGYMFKDKVLRPALVKVAVHPADSATDETVN
jgi:molecular chaperone GrpE